MRRSNISLRLGGAEIDDAIFARRSLIEELLLSRQYSASGVKNEGPDSEVGVLGSVTLLMSKWDNKSNPSSVVSSTTKVNIAANNEVTSASADLSSAHNNLHTRRFALSTNIDTDSNSNSRYSIYTGESDNMTVMIDEDDFNLEDYEDEEFDGGDYDDDAEDDEDDYDEIENLELAEALRIVRGRKAWNINDYRARYRALKRKADSDNNDNCLAAKIENVVCENHGEKRLDGRAIRMVKIVIEREHEHGGNPLSKNGRLREKYGLVQSGPVSSLRDSSAKYYEDSGLRNGFENTSFPLTNNVDVEAYEPIDREVEVSFYF